MPVVLVVGAGPVGLTMAAELARHGVACRIIDKLATPLPFCRAIGVTPRTLEVWDAMGIARQMMDAGLWITGTRSFVNNKAMPDVHNDLFGLPYGHFGLPQPETERILEEHLGSFGIDVERGVTLTALKQDADSVQVELLRADGSTEAASFQYVVGCDGAHSSVRRLVEIPFEGDQYPFTFMLGDVVVDTDTPRGVVLRSIRPVEKSAPDFFIAIPLPARNRYRVSTLAPEAPGPPDTEHGLQTSLPGPRLEELQVVADRLFPMKARLSDMVWSSRFRISARLAARYREGRAFLAGDAAHIHPPTGGQGMNTGIQDAYNLAWKMALVVRGLAAAELLDTYDAERRPEGADVVTRTQAQSEQLGRKEAAADERLIATQVLVNYRASGLSREQASGEVPVHAGDRAPDCSGLVGANVRYPYRLFDVIRGTEYVVLWYVDKPVVIPEGLGCRVVLVCPADAASFDVIGAAVYRDSAGEFAAAYAPELNTGFVIRPDGYVGYHARPLSVQGLADYLQ